MSVMELLYMMSISSTYRKDPKMLFRIRTSYIAVCSTYNRWISEKIEEVGLPLQVQYFEHKNYSGI